MSFLKDYLNLLKIRWLIINQITKTIKTILLEIQASIFEDTFQDANVTLHTISSPHVQ